MLISIHHEFAELIEGAELSRGGELFGDLVVGVVEPPSGVAPFAKLGVLGIAVFLIDLSQCAPGKQVPPPALDEDLAITRLVDALLLKFVDATFHATRLLQIAFDSACEFRV